MNKLFPSLAAITLFSSIAFSPVQAQSTAFEGLFSQVGIGYESVALAFLTATSQWLPLAQRPLILLLAIPMDLLASLLLDI